MANVKRDGFGGSVMEAPTRTQRISYRCKLQSSRDRDITYSAINQPVFLRHLTRQRAPSTVERFRMTRQAESIRRLVAPLSVTFLKEGSELIEPR